ncbi:hypothetical protein [Oenococcus oeni]|uniref:hypothetical protein n=2 Tax=Oenococcus oeni TaxID=1247 RepID=UPI000277BA84|nr:hypothetical protein [Oenococcus oeni]EJO05139.1 hypothetical protein AWRIB548_1464 [Oenococcus oeni AWRIB548]KEP86162.1 hypothetical protein X278_02460 [Oenococcus oeni IOEB_0205]PDH75116.1 hypothetical protein AO457_07485 [Oenococcus oeni]PDH82788.1 hypothetical protein AO459_01120 [Oenococcus oeni]PDH83153.1 hypothetical protein AO458_00010 [Oenococcus oeni]
MQFLLLPLTFLSKFFDVYGFFLVFLVILWTLFKRPEDIPKIIPSWKTFIFWSVMILFQFLAMLLSFPFSAKANIPIGMFKSFSLILEEVLMIWMVYAFSKLFIVSKIDAVKFIRWAIYGYILYSFLVIVPEVFITLGFHFFDGYINFLASIFETRWTGRTDFYGLGSYVVTQGRVNGFEGESPVFANLLGVVYIPIFIGLIIGKDHSVFKKPAFILWPLVIFSMVVLLMAKTTTGILTIIFLYISWLFFSNSKDRRFLLFMGIIGLLIIGCSYIFINPVHTIFNQFLFQKQGTSNRIGGTIGLILTFLSKPIFGTGQGFAGYFINENVPLWSTHNWEYQYIYSKLGYPVLSGLFGAFAQYGLVIMVPFLFFFSKYIFNLSAKRKHYFNLGVRRDDFYFSMLNSSEITLFVIIFSSILSFDLFKWSIFFILFFYWRIMYLSDIKNKKFPEIN